MLSVIYFCLVTVLSALNAEEGPVITIENGLIRGSYKKSYDGRKFAAFEGIPYAQPPIGSLRFKDPQLPINWKGILEATTLYKCLQLERLNKNVIGQEDCLYLNVYTPRQEIGPNEKLDVIAHFHGGAFIRGYPGEIDGPSKLMDRDVIYVSLNYRIGPLGFLSSGDAILPGNYGMKDQVFALQWIQRNIGKFGGNPNSVTITGSSAGGASVHLHYFSPLSKGLFHRGFAANGIVLNPWTIRKDSWSRGVKIVKDVGCLNESIQSVLHCLRERPAVQIEKAFARLFQKVELYLPLVLFGPTIEPHLPTSFLTADPYLQLKTKLITDVPFMSIMTTEEGLLPAYFYLQNLDELSENVHFYFPWILEYDSYDESTQDQITNKLMKHYFNNEPISKKNFDIFVKICTERLFHIGAEKSLKLQASTAKSNVYFIMMAYGGENTGYENFGVGHCQDAKFYYSAARMGANRLTNEEVEMKDTFLDMLINFAKTGVPIFKNVTFESVPEDGSLRYLLIKGPNRMEMTRNSLGDVDFWRSLELLEDENVYNIQNDTLETF